jgi:hypothetical protein
VCAADDDDTDSGNRSATTAAAAAGAAAAAAAAPPPKKGRLLHHLAEVSGFKLSGVEVVVFDEADRMFEMGFAEQVGAHSATITAATS